LIPRQNTVELSVRETITGKHAKPATLTDPTKPL
jgi:hypothetical protein